MAADDVEETESDTRAKRQWAVVKGPAAAVCATLARIGWTMVDATTAYTDRQLEVSFLKDSPAMVERLIRESVLPQVAGVASRIQYIWLAKRSQQLSHSLPTVSNVAGCASS